MDIVFLETRKLAQYEDGDLSCNNVIMAQRFVKSQYFYAAKSAIYNYYIISKYIIILYYYIIINLLYGQKGALL